MMPETKCRVCGQHFHSQPLLKLSGMPKSAQNFPDRKSVKKDHGVDLNVFQCSGCGLVQLADRPVPYYREVIRAAAISDVVKDFKTRQFSSFIRKHALKNKRIIEIGCGNGEFNAELGFERCLGAMIAKNGRLLFSYEHDDLFNILMIGSNADPSVLILPVNNSYQRKIDCSSNCFNIFNQFYDYNRFSDDDVKDA